METDKALTVTSMVIAGLVILLFVLDAAVGIPFGRRAIVLDVLFALGGAFVLWQGVETYREFRCCRDPRARHGDGRRNPARRALPAG